MHDYISHIGSVPICNPLMVIYWIFYGYVLYGYGYVLYGYGYVLYSKVMIFQEMSYIHRKETS
jgi:hypothetical protein